MAKSAQTKSITSISHRGEWLCRDTKRNGYIVRVPCQGGHGFFSIDEYGSSAKAHEAARKFHAKMERQLQKDREYEKKHGEKPFRHVLNIRNTSGHHGIARNVYPVLDGSPRIVYTVTWRDSHGWPASKSFSSVQYKHDEYALEAALEFRDQVRPELKGK